MVTNKNRKHIQTERGEVVRVRNASEYRLEFIAENGSVDTLPLVMSYPSEAVKVSRYLNEMVMESSMLKSHGTYVFSKREILK